MAAVRKFLFDNSFDAPTKPKREAAPPPPPEPEPPPPPPGFSEEELAAACARARAEGEEAGRAAALAAAEASREQALLQAERRLAAVLQQLFGELDQRARLAEQQALETATAILRRLFPELARRHGETEIVALLGECLALAHEEPRVVVRAADLQLDALRERLAGLREGAGFEGRVVLLADADLGPSDVRVEWADGGMERDAERTWREIDAVIQRTLAAAADEPPADQRS